MRATERKVKTEKDRLHNVKIYLCYSVDNIAIVRDRETKRKREIGRKRITSRIP